MSEIENIKRFAPMFSGNALDRKDHWRNDTAKMADVLNAENLKFIVFVDGKPFMDVSAALDIYYFSKAELPIAKKWEDSSWVFLGVEDNSAPIIAIDLTSAQPPFIEELGKRDVKAIDLRSIAFQFASFDVDNGRAAILGAGKALLDWHARHGFCAQCGAKTVATRAGFQRKCPNETCQAEHFPRTDPVVIMLIINGDECLLGRSPNFEVGVYSALAGFMEPGETIEEAVKREVMEEVAIDVSNVRYEVSQPWPFPSSLMIGCVADAENKDFTIDGLELESARWFTRKEISAGLVGASGLDFTLPPKLALANLLLQIWVEQGEV